jgi:hypothetical protein
MRTSLTQSGSHHFDGQFMNEVVAAARLVPPEGIPLDHLFEWMVDRLRIDSEAVLDLLHYAIQLAPSSPYRARIDSVELDRILELGGSVWRATAHGLVRRVDPLAQQAFDAATRPRDSASEELDEAWDRAYGRNPNASDAWDHAIKAVEAGLRPIVIPRQAGGHIGHIVGELDHRGDRFEMPLESKQGLTPIQTLVGMLRLLYPNPDRHVGPDHRVPTLEEARAVVHLAVTIVQWARDGQIVRR